jgi:hypothetical protein
MRIDNKHRRLTNSGCAVQRDALAPGIQQQQIRYVDHTRGSRYVKSCHETTVLPDGSILEVPLAYLTPWLGAAFGHYVCVGWRGCRRIPWLIPVLTLFRETPMTIRFQSPAFARE